MTRSRTSTGWMRKLRRRRRALLQHGRPKADATDVAAIAIGDAGGAVAAADAGQAAGGMEAATTVVGAEADGRSGFWLLVARLSNRDRGDSRLSSPPTPPYMRVRIRRFGGLS